MRPPQKGPAGKSAPSLKEQIEQLPEGSSPLTKLVGKYPRDFREIDMPGRYAGDEEYGKVALVPIRDSEALDARLAAHKFLLEVKKLPEWLLETEQGQGMLDTEIQIHVLHQVMRVPNNLNQKFT